MPQPRFEVPTPGDMVTLRVATPVGPISVVGEVVEADSERWAVRRRDGQTVEVLVASIEAKRDVAPGKARQADPVEVEQVAALGWRACETARLGDWLLRFADGFTRRANSALTIGDPGRGLDAALAAVTDWYAERGRPPLLQQPDAVTGVDLVAALTERGWTSAGATHVMTGEIAHGLRGMPDAISAATRAGLELRIEDAPDEAWLTCYRRAEGPSAAVAREVLVNHPAALFASLRAGGRVVAVARAAVDARWAGLFAVEVVPEARRRGLGAAVSLAVLKEAARHRARQAYLQVETGNEPAVALYRRLNFRVHHDYRYWSPPSK